MAEPIPPGGRGSAIAILPYAVDYRPVAVGAGLQVRDGPNEAGTAWVEEVWSIGLKVLHGDAVLGVALLNLTDDGMGVFSGPFLPYDPYDAVRPVFRRFAEALPLTSSQTSDADAIKAYYESRDALGLSLVDWLSDEPATANWIHILDFGDLDDLSAEVQGLPPNSV